MKLASLEGGPEGRLFVVSDDMGWRISAAEIAPTLSAAMADWDRCEPLLRGVAAFLNRGAQRYVRFEPAECRALCRGTVASGEALEFRRGAAVMVGPVPKGASRAEAAAAARLVMLQMDGPMGVASSPLAVTPDALGDAWRDGRLICAPTLEVDADLAASAPVVFDFAASIQEAARAGGLAEGAVIHVADPRPARLARLAEGEVVRYELRDGLSRSTFGAIELKAVVAAEAKVLA
jgi:fumarylacetoacetate (FAA) hydrolase